MQLEGTDCSNLHRLCDHKLPRVSISEGYSIHEIIIASSLHAFLRFNQLPNAVLTSDRCSVTYCMALTVIPVIPDAVISCAEM